MGRGADWVGEVGSFRVEQYGPLMEVRENQGSYPLTLYGKLDRDNLRRLLDQMDQHDAAGPDLALDERRRA